MIHGLVIRGKGVGKGLGYPTANLDTDPVDIYLSTGVYAGISTLDRKKYKSALIILADAQKIEIHLLDYTGDDFYGSALTVEPIQKVSEIEKLNSKEELIKKIEEDITLVKNLFTGRNDL